jgi:hypothetical protein
VAADCAENRRGLAAGGQEIVPRGDFFLSATWRGLRFWEEHGVQIFSIDRVRQYFGAGFP